MFMWTYFYTSTIYCCQGISNVSLCLLYSRQMQCWAEGKAYRMSRLNATRVAARADRRREDKEHYSHVLSAVDDMKISKVSDNLGMDTGDESDNKVAFACRIPCWQQSSSGCNNCLGHQFKYGFHFYHNQFAFSAVRSTFIPCVSEHTIGFCSSVDSITNPDV